MFGEASVGRAEIEAFPPCILCFALGLQMAQGTPSKHTEALLFFNTTIKTH